MGSHLVDPAIRNFHLVHPAIRYLHGMHQARARRLQCPLLQPLGSRVSCIYRQTSSFAWAQLMHKQAGRQLCPMLELLQGLGPYLTASIQSCSPFLQPVRLMVGNSIQHCNGTPSMKAWCRHASKPLMSLQKQHLHALSPAWHPNQQSHPCQPCQPLICANGSTFGSDEGVLAMQAPSQLLHIVIIAGVVSSSLNQ